MGGRGLIDARARAGAPGQHGPGGCARTACAPGRAGGHGAGGAPARLGPCHRSAGVRGGGDVVGTHLLLGHVHLAHVRPVHPCPRAPDDRPPDRRGRGPALDRPAVARAPVHVRPLAGRRRRGGRRFERGRIRAGIRDARGAPHCGAEPLRSACCSRSAGRWCNASCSPRRVPRATPIRSSSACSGSSSRKSDRTLAAPGGAHPAAARALGQRARVGAPRRGDGRRVLRPQRRCEPAPEGVAAGGRGGGAVGACGRVRLCDAVRHRP